jgi:hypothetical protein
LYIPRHFFAFSDEGPDSNFDRECELFGAMRQLILAVGFANSKISSRAEYFTKLRSGIGGVEVRRDLGLTNLDRCVIVGDVAVELSRSVVVANGRPNGLAQSQLLERVDGVRPQ